MNYNEFAKEVHENAVAHGWCDEERSAGEIIALCHSEVSEALEEYRAGRPNVWFMCHGTDGVCREYCVNRYSEGCINGLNDDKPEGIAVELADVVIRCFDYFGKVGVDVEALLEDAKTLHGLKWWFAHLDERNNFGEFVAILHAWLSEALKQGYSGFGLRTTCLNMAVCCNLIFEWAEYMGVDMDEVMRIKHEYNKGRGYKHGGKVM